MTIADAQLPTIENVSVYIPQQPVEYTVHIGRNLLENMAFYAMAVTPKASRYVIITEKTVAALYLPIVEQALQQTGVPVQTIVIPAGEASKSFATAQHIAEQLLAIPADRKTVLVALGGGVIGDLVGFVAAIVLRGIPFIQVPTTLLAQVDSSVGGKTGINTAQGKNLIGSFKQPAVVVADTGILQTLPERQLRAGYAEVLKYGLLGNSLFFKWLQKNGAAVCYQDGQERLEAVTASVQAKADIVQQDEKEQGLRALLNLGHTFGHAIEAATGFSDAVYHGEAVAMGCLIACALSVHLGHCAPEASVALEAHQKALGYAVTLPELTAYPWQAEELLQLMANDKKNSNGTKTFILMRDIGTAFISADVPDSAVLHVLNSFIG